jgi:putative oxidoreductase
MRYDDAGKLILRMVLGGLILLHGIAKLSGGVDGISGMVTAVGLPQFLTYGVYFGEVIAPLLVIAGFYSRLGAAIIAINMLFALALAHRADLFSLSESGGWAIELQAMFLFTAIAVALIGPGRYAINNR